MVSIKRELPKTLLAGVILVKPLPNIPSENVLFPQALQFFVVATNITSFFNIVFQSSQQLRPLVEHFLVFHGVS